MIGYIYKTTNLINGKIYIGKHKASVFTESYKGSGKIVQQAFNKYGWDNFKVELLVECDSEEQLNQEERRLIAKYNSQNHEIGYNLTGGGEGLFNPSPELRQIMAENAHNRPTKDSTREKLRQNALGNKYFEGHTHTQEWKDNMSKLMTNREFSEDTHKKMSDSAKGRSMRKATEASANARRGKPLPESTKIKLSLANTGRVVSEETRKKISEANTGRRFHLSEDARKKISLSNSRREITDSMRESISKSKSKYIYIFDDLEFYGWKKIRDYLRSIGYEKISQAAISKLSSGKSVLGYEDLVGKITWRYANED